MQYVGVYNQMVLYHNSSWKYYGIHHFKDTPYILYTTRARASAYTWSKYWELTVSLSMVVLSIYNMSVGMHIIVPGSVI